MAEFDPGRFKDRITILQPGRAQQGKYGTHAVAWTEMVTVWGEVRDMLPSRAERIAEGLEISRRPCRVRIRHRGDVRTDMRLRFLGRTLRIVAIAEVGRREVLEIAAEELSTEGQDS
ncbi:Phage head-tail adaptor, putative [Novosphingobium aromaticivorans DSM 12444]|uniref:Phage head-tail adaptor, putative n=1 Tax=Novosphingobium aromaticivorans (strain ATCC 700278 / DSM 12444 / CCUG 56034 / CIP 105152 / NBRC 16084 / F199) TaxID=279238 RepID=Q2GAM3_NOVAD|nr:phage head closure protein [Novosphingobium aromaticivorans]ABD25100.1 Phage head-tail adaptor, putative [Novosphingobium aromaticivorans DSM 12444]SCY95855.1 phage head-tail adaptor, putative, SPP1 family [Novosphingobium aromaticivorans]